jgi:hypothetical protein
MDISDVARVIAKMTGMNKSSREEFVEFCEELEDRGVIEDLSDLDELDLSDLDNFDFDDFDFIEDLDFDMRGGFDPGMGSRGGKRSAEDYRRTKDSDEDQVDIHVPDNDDATGPYQDETWIQVEDGYETFVDIPDNVSDVNITITMEDGHVVVSEPVGEELEVSHLPDKVTEIEAEKTRNRLLIMVR